MKPLLILGIFLMILVFAQFAQAQTVEDVIEKNITAMGSAAKLKQLQTVKMEGNMDVMGNDVAITITKKHNIGLRNDIVVAGTENYQIAIPSSGSIYMPIQGMSSPTSMQEDLLKTMQLQYDLQSPLINYKENGIAISLIGKETIDGTECFHLKLTYKNGVIADNYYSAKDYFLIKNITKVGKEETPTTYGDYKQNADGFWFPYSVSNSRGIIYFSKIEANVSVDESIFK